MVTLETAFERALAVVDRSVAAGLRAADGEPAAPHLERLRARLIAERDLAIARGSIDPVWVRSVVRWVAEWAPESDIALLAALGAIARAKRQTPEL